LFSESIRLSFWQAEAVTEVYQRQVAAEKGYIIDEALPDLRLKIRSLMRSREDSSTLMSVLPLEFWQLSLDAIEVASVHIKLIDVEPSAKPDRITSHTDAGAGVL
jgi:hypothetical protein